MSTIGLNLNGTLTATNITDTGLTNNTALTTDGSNQITSSSTTTTELGYVHGVTSAIQTQLNAAKNITSSTTTNLTGILTGNGSVVGSTSTPLSVANGGTDRSNYTLADSSGYTAVDWSANRLLVDTSNVTSVDWKQRLLYDYAGSPVINYNGPTPSVYSLNVASLTPSQFVGTNGSSNLISVSTPLSVANGGTGASSLTATGVAYFNDGGTALATDETYFSYSDGGSAKVLNVNAIQVTNNAATVDPPLYVAGGIETSLTTASRALVTDTNNLLASSTTTGTELGYVHGVTSAIQTQLNAINPSPVYAVTVSLSSAQILNLYSSGVTLVAAPGAGKVIQCLSAVMDFTAGTPYVASNSPLIAATTGSPSSNSSQFQLGVGVFAGSSAVYQGVAISPSLNNSQMFANNALIICYPSANPTTGTGTANVYITYQTITL